MSNLRWSRPAAALLAVLFPAAAWADLSGTPTLSANTRFSFDTGATVTSGGDILFTGSSITMQGSATEFSLGATGSSEYNILNQPVVGYFEFMAAMKRLNASGTTVY
jgi:hypothetical protein